MSPRELARYALIHVTDGIREYCEDRSERNEAKFIQIKRSFYETYIRGLSDDEYIEYLEQLLKETEYQQCRTSTDYLLSIYKYDLLCCEIRHDLRGDCIESEKNDIIKSIEEAEKDIADMDRELASNRYLKRAIVSDILIRSTWEKMQ